MEALPSSIPLLRTESGHPLSAYVVEVLKAEPDRIFHVREVAQKVRGKLDTVNRTLSRLSKTGKGGGPVQNTTRGFYKYDPAKKQGNLIDFAGFGEWKIENFTLVRIVARGTSGQGTNTTSDDPKQAEARAHSGQTTDTNQTQLGVATPIPKPGHPWNLATGQEVFWGKYRNGTEIIRVSANGKPPISLDLVLQLIDGFQLDLHGRDEWKCTSLEVNRDSRTRKFEGAYTMRVFEGLLIKAYDHDNAVARVEVANRQPLPLREITDLFNYLQGGIEGKEALRKAKALEARVAQNEKDTRLALNIARKVRDREPPKKSGMMQAKKDPVPAFYTGTEILKGKVTVGAEKREEKKHEWHNITGG